MSRFDYVKYDDISAQHQALAKEQVEAVETVIDQLPDSRAKELAYNKLEECYMWIGKAIRDELISREGNPISQEERCNS